MRASRKQRRSGSGGFTLIETLVVVAMLVVIMGAVFQQIDNLQKKSVAEQSKLDLFQEGREFMDQLTRDLRDTGYPNYRNFSATTANYTSTGQSNIAIGLVKASASHLQFEANAVDSTDGHAFVKEIEYKLLPATSNPNCPCLQRSETAKQDGTDPVDQAGNLLVEVQNILNGNDPDHPIFRYLDDDGNEVGVDPELNSNSQDASGNALISKITAIEVTLVIQSPVVDPQTRQKPTMTLVSSMRLHNCAIGGGGTMSCEAQ